MADIRRDEEPLRVGVHEHRLETVGRRAPDREPPVAVMVGQHHHERALTADEERRRAVAEPLLDLGQPKADAAEPLEGCLAPSGQREV